MVVDGSLGEERRFFKARALRAYTIDARAPKLAAVFDFNI